MRYISASNDPKLSIIVLAPDADNQPSNDCLSLAIRCFSENTTNPYELLISDNKPESLNDCIDKCKCDAIIFSAFNFIPCKDWDTSYINSNKQNTALSQFLIESLVSSDSYYKDFGKCAKCFKRDEFEAYASKIMQRYSGWRANGGWPKPGCISKDLLKTFKFEQLDIPIDLQLCQKITQAKISIKRNESCWYRLDDSRCRCYAH